MTTLDTSAMNNKQTDNDQSKPPTSPRMLRIMWGIFLDAGIAVVAYVALRALGQSEYISLLGATIVAGIRLGYVMIRRREIDGFALFMMVTFGVGFALSLVSGSVHFLLAKESIGTSVSGLLFLVTCLWGKPLMFYAARRFTAASEQERAGWDNNWNSNAGFRKYFRFVSVVWGIAFLIEAAVRIPFVYILPVDVMAVISPLATPIMITGLLVWTFSSSRKAVERSQGQVQM